MIAPAAIRAAAERIRPYVVRTPLERSAALSERCGVDVWLKLECFQKTGSFKLRGALNALLTLSEAARRRGVLAVSAGNHALGVAHAAMLLGVDATLVVPETASAAKRDALRQYPARLVERGRDYDAAEQIGRELAEREGRTFISAYNDEAVIAGAGTIALEALEDAPEARSFVVPAGGGGLVSGIGVAAHGVRPELVVYGAQSSASPALYAAARAGGRIEVEVQPSLADGLAGNVEEGSITFDLLRAHVRDVVLVDEPEIAEAMRFLLLHEHVLVEGSAAVGVAALLHDRLGPDAPTVLILSGRNVAASVLEQYVFASACGSEHGPV